MSTLPVRIDYQLALREGTGRADAPRESDLQARFEIAERATRQVLARVESKELGFWTLPEDTEALERVQSVANRVSTEIQDILLLGIGGSSLGARAIYHALAGPPELVRGQRLHMPDNADPWTLSRLLDQLDPQATLAVVASKSGGTVETAAQLLVVKAWFERARGSDSLARHLFVVTDPAQGPLLELARNHGLTALSIPQNVGGRFSVLTPVGLLPAALCDLDVRSLLDGARQMAAACRRESTLRNPASLLAALHDMHHREFGRSIHVLMPYSDALRPFAAWWVQLWAESLGKRTNRRGDVVEIGPTPIPAIGAADQHAQMQLFMEGPRDKLVTFIAVKEPTRDIPIPHEPGPFAYLGGHTLHALLEFERRGTRQALARDGRPSLTLEVDRVDAHHLGALFFLFEAATAIAGELYDINAFDQPGVEEGKRLACGLLGRPGYEAAADEVRSFESDLSAHHRLE